MQLWFCWIALEMCIPKDDKISYSTSGVENKNHDSTIITKLFELWFCWIALEMCIPKDDKISYSTSGIETKRMIAQK